MNRRTFVKTTAAFSTLAAAGSALPQTAQAPQRHHVRHDQIRWRSVLEKFKAVKAAGFDGIEPMSHMSQAEVLDAFHADWTFRRQRLLRDSLEESCV